MSLNHLVKCDIVFIYLAPLSTAAIFVRCGVRYVVVTVTQGGRGPPTAPPNRLFLCDLRLHCRAPRPRLFTVPPLRIRAIQRLTLRRRALYKTGNSIGYCVAVFPPNWARRRKERTPAPLLLRPHRKL